MSVLYNRIKTIFTAIAVAAVLVLAAGCNRSQAPAADFVVTLPPLKMILEPLVAGRKTVTCLVPPGASPHTFALRPSDATQLTGASALFYVDDSMDGWAAQLAPGATYSVMAMVPAAMQLQYDFGHGHGDTAERESANPHFWSDPRTVAAVVPELLNVLVAIDPEGASHYNANAESFLGQLETLDQALERERATWPPMTLVAFHPSWSYYFKRYDVPVAAYVEPVPGKELSPRTILDLRRQLAGGAPVVVLSEVQLPRRSAEALAEALGARITEIDPLGGKPPLDGYDALLHYNAARLREALQ